VTENGFLGIAVFGRAAVTYREHGAPAATGWSHGVPLAGRLPQKDRTGIQGRNPASFLERRSAAVRQWLFSPGVAAGPAAALPRWADRAAKRIGIRLVNIEG
jgi:hypothetical protein